MTTAYLLVAAGYLALTLIVLQAESRRTRHSGIDVTTIFIVLALIQCCIPGIAIYGTLPFVDPSAPTGVEVFDRIYQSTDLTISIAVLMLTAWFFVFFYFAAALSRLAIERLLPERWKSVRVSLYVVERRLIIILLIGLALSVLSFYRLGDTMVGRYTGLILFRGNAPEIERNALNANAFALTQTWGWLAVIAVLTAYELRRRDVRWFIALVIAIVFAILGVSRRALFLPLLFAYLTFALRRGGWRLRWIIIGTVPLIFWLAFGKELLAAMAFGVSVESVGGNYQSWTSALLRAASDTGLTIVESVGTLLFLHMDVRAGVDHMLSLAQRFPEGILGLDFDFPERIVRTSTEAFADANAQDIPPGFAGQMWLDFRILGPVVWGLIFGVQVAFLQAFFERTRRSLQAASVFVLLAFVVVLPINTGSFDFSFSVDIFALIFALLVCVRLRAVEYSAASEPALSPLLGRT
jgi:hypothetical protein